MLFPLFQFFSFTLADTYKSRVRRASLDYSSSEESVPPSVDIDFAEKKIIAEYGPKACVIEEPCKINALRPGQANAQPDWVDILRYLCFFFVIKSIWSVYDLIFFSLHKIYF